MTEDYGFPEPPWAAAPPPDTMSLKMMTERRFPAASDAQRVAARPSTDGDEFRIRPSNIDHEIQRCRGMIQAAKAERLFQSTLDGRRGY